MKKIILIITLFFASNAMSQDGVQFGLNVSPSWKINMSKQKGTGIRNNQSGYGFNAGVPIKYWLNEFRSLNTGLDFEFTAFDYVQNGFLVSSFRFSSLHLPVMFNFHLSGSLYAMVGTGVVYNFAVRDLNVAQGTDLTGVTNNVQPYLGFGLNSLIEKDFGYFEVGVQGRYQVLDIWKSSYEKYEDSNSHLAALDLILRYYF
ncbi:MAG: hypothetical protein ACI8ZM_002437 [Crocinitomix sp.]|jgi:hypothetical protein